MRSLCIDTVIEIHVVSIGFSFHSSVVTDLTPILLPTVHEILFRWMLKPSSNFTLFVFSNHSAF
jgi:hypothetical protein